VAPPHHRQPRIRDSILNRSVSLLIDGVLARSPAQFVFQRIAASKLAVLAYHSIDDPERFAAHLELIRRSARPVSVDDVVGAVAGRSTLPKRAVLITFDDADATIRDVAMPMLQDRGIPAAAFVVTGSLDSDRPLWPDEIHDLIAAGGRLDGSNPTDSDAIVRSLKLVPDDRRVHALEQLRASAGRPAAPVAQLATRDLARLEAAGIAIGSHTHTHPCLDRCTEEQVRREITSAHEILSAALGHPPSAFAYPNGDLDDRVVRVVRETGYVVAFLFDHRMSDAPPANALRISRVRTNAAAGSDRLRALLSGLHPAIHAMRARRAPTSPPAGAVAREYRS